MQAATSPDLEVVGPFIQVWFPSFYIHDSSSHRSELPIRWENYAAWITSTAPNDVLGHSQNIRHLTGCLPGEKALPLDARTEENISGNETHHPLVQPRMGIREQIWRFQWPKT